MESTSFLHLYSTIKPSNCWWLKTLQFSGKNLAATLQCASQEPPSAAAGGASRPLHVRAQIHRQVCNSLRTLCSVLYCTVCTILYCSLLSCYVLLYCSVLLFFTVLLCITVLLCVTGLYCPVMYCSVLLYFTALCLYCTVMNYIVLKCTVLYCAVLYCAVQYCTVL
jgi:hypothetical protein